MGEYSYSCNTAQAEPAAIPEHGENTMSNTNKALLKEINHLEKIVGMVKQTTIDDILCEGETETANYLNWLKRESGEIMDEIYVRICG